MAESEEARQVFDALDRLEAIKDPLERARAISEHLADARVRNPRLTQQRRAVVQELRAQGLSLRKIAAAVGTSLGTVQDILRGYSSSWSERPKAPDGD